ncbi:TPA: hypothetical protein ACIBQR_004514, partial [Salmonella enterica subsp. enterica serovar Chester]
GKLQPHSCNFLQIFNSTGDIKMRMFQKIAMVSTAATCLALCGNAMAAPASPADHSGMKSIAANAEAYPIVTAPAPTWTLTSTNVNPSIVMTYDSNGNPAQNVVDLATFKGALVDPSHRTADICVDMGSSAIFDNTSGTDVTRKASAKLKVGDNEMLLSTGNTINCLSGSDLNNVGSWVIQANTAGLYPGKFQAVLRTTAWYK